MLGGFTMNTMQFYEQKVKSVYNGFGIIHAIGYLSNDMHGQWYYSVENLQNNTGPIHNIDKSIPNGYILSNKDKYTILCNNNGCYEIPLEKNMKRVVQILLQTLFTKK